MSLRQSLMENLVVSAILFNVAGLVEKAVIRNSGIVGGCFFLLKSYIANSKIKKFDKTQLKYVNKNFQEADE